MPQILRRFLRHACFRASLTFLAAACIASPAPASCPSNRMPAPDGPKAYLKVNLRDLCLAWNGDQGEAGRGRGEVYVSIWISWPSAVEREDPQHGEYGPLNGDVEFKSGTIKESPPGSGTFTIEPACVQDKHFGQIYYNEADCPVSTTVLIDALVWEEDSDKTLDDFKKKIEEGAKSAADKAAKNSGVATAGELASSALGALLDLLSGGGDDALGRVDTLITIPDPCGEAPFILDVTLNLENLAKDLWTDVNAEAEDGTSFSSKGIVPPDNIGTLKLRLIGGPKTNKSSAKASKQYLPSNEDLRSVDLGQPNECALTGVLALGAALPLDALSPTYSLFLDMDNCLLTGAPAFPSQGAEFEMRCVVHDSTSLEGHLLHWNGASGQFVEVPGGLHDLTLNPDRASIFYTATFDQLGAPGDSVAAWGAAQSNSGLHVVPADPLSSACIIAPHTDYSGVPPMVVGASPTHDAADVGATGTLALAFSKVMNEQNPGNPVTIVPSASFSTSWNGDQVVLTPLAPLAPYTTYHVTTTPVVSDCIGTPLDGDGDLSAGDPFDWTFTTEPLPLHSCDSTGTRKGSFTPGQHVFVTGSAFPPSASVAIYVVAHDREGLASHPLVDVTQDGPNSAGTTPLGVLPLMQVGPAPGEGEYNVVADVNRDGLFTPGTDRVDRVTIGFGVLLSGPVAVRREPDLGTAALTGRPTPFSRATVLSFRMPRSGHVRIAVYTVRGALVRVLFDGERPAGRGEVVWNGRDARGRRVDRGVYYARIEGAGIRASTPVTLLP